MTLVPCARCRRHVRRDDARCPFCALGSEAPSPWEGNAFRRACVSVAAAAAATATLGACYGAPPKTKRLHEHTIDIHEPSERVFAWIAGGAAAAGCVARILEDGSRSMDCNELAFTVTAHEKTTIVRCHGGSVSVCRERLDAVRAAAPAVDGGPP